MPHRHARARTLPVHRLGRLHAPRSMASAHKAPSSVAIADHTFTAKRETNDLVKEWGPWDSPKGEGNGDVPSITSAAEGFEPLTFGSVDRCSIQLSYGRIFQKAPILTHPPRESPRNTAPLFFLAREAPAPSLAREAPRLSWRERKRRALSGREAPRPLWRAKRRALSAREAPPHSVAREAPRTLAPSQQPRAFGHPVGVDP